MQSRWPLIAGPLVFFLAAVVPIDGASWEVRAGLGMLFWMALWWITRCVALEATSLIPLALSALTPIAPVSDVTAVYSHRLVFLIIGATAIATAWRYWGLAKRLSLWVLARSGSDTRRQVWIWFLLAVVFSAFTADTIVAAILVPIAIALLSQIGYDSPGARWRSPAATAILLAVAWGASIGSLPIPVGDGLNLIVYEYVRELHDGAFHFGDWAVAMLPYTVVLVPVTGWYITRFMDLGPSQLAGSRDVYRRELEAMGPVRAGEVISGVAFLLPLVANFLHPLYRSAVPWLDPVYLFLIGALACHFFRDDGEPVVSFKALANFPVTLVFLWPGAIALARILEASGVAQVLADLLVPVTEHGGFLAVMVVLGVGVILSNVTTNTASAALLAPIVISLHTSLGLNPVPMLLAVAPAVNLSFAVASGNGCLAVSAGSGVNLKTMFRHGVRLAVLNYGLTVIIALVMGTLRGGL